MTTKPLFKRVLLKASGEAMMGSQGFGIDVAVADRIAADIAEVRAMDVEVGVVVGGGNIFRGVAVASKGGDRVTGDHMGMLATVINALALATSLRTLGIDRVLSESDADRRVFPARRCIFAQAGWCSSPAARQSVFTTDSAAALRAAEMGAEAILKGTQVDGIYSATPRPIPKRPVMTL